MATPDSNQTSRALPSRLSRLVQRGHGALLALLLALLTAAVFVPSLRDDFVAWDDNHTFYENPHIQGLDAGRLHWMFTDVSYSMRYKPLSWLGYALIYEAGGLRPFGYHLAGLLFHCLNTALLFLVLRRLLEIGFAREPSNVPADVISLFAALAALLWAVHPLRVEPVVRATDLTYGQTLFFTLISLWCYLRAVAPPANAHSPVRWFAAAVVAFALAMLSYPFVLGYAVVLLALDFYPLRRFPRAPGGWRDAATRRLWLEKLPFILLAALVLMTLYGRLNPGDAFAARKMDLHAGLFARAAQAFYVWAYYLWKPFAPFNLSPVYMTLVDFNPLAWPFLASAVLVIGLTLLLAWKRRDWPLAFTLWICHLVLLIPALGLTEHPHYANDRYSYIAGILWPAFIAAACLSCWRRRPQFALRAGAALLALAAVFGVMSRRQIRVWRDTPTLFNYMIAKLGRDPYREDIHMRLGAWYADRHDLDDAIVQFQAAHDADPASAGAENMLAGMWSLKGRPDEALAHFREAVRLAPDYLDARRNLAYACYQLGRTDDAILQYQEAVRLDPADPDTRQILGTLLCNQGRYADAITQLQAALQLQPNYAEAHNGLGVALFRQGKLDEAISQFQAALKLKPDYADARASLRVALDKQSGH